MLRRVDYRIAINLFVFTGLWFVIGAIVLWSPLPGVLGIGGGLFVMWVLLFFGVLAVAGSALTLAAINTAFPGAQAARAAQNLEPRTENRVTEGGGHFGIDGAPQSESREQRAENRAPARAPATKAGTSSPPRTRKPARTPLWAPSQTDASTPENSPNPPLDAPQQTRRPQRGDA